MTHKKRLASSTERVFCPLCSGTGVLDDHVDDVGRIEASEPCFACGGSGKVTAHQRKKLVIQMDRMEAVSQMEAELADEHEAEQLVIEFGLEQTRESRA